MSHDAITRNNGKIRTFEKPGKLYIIRKVMMRVSENRIFIEIE